MKLLRTFCQTLSCHTPIAYVQLYLNYHLLFLPGGSPAQIPWSELETHWTEQGVADWLVLTPARAADVEVWVRPPVAEALVERSGGAFALPDR